MLRALGARNIVFLEQHLHRGRAADWVPLYSISTYSIIYILYAKLSSSMFCVSLHTHTAYPCVYIIYTKTVNKMLELESRAYTRCWFGSGTSLGQRCTVSHSMKAVFS